MASESRSLRASLGRRLFSKLQIDVGRIESGRWRRVEFDLLRILFLTLVVSTIGCAKWSNIGTQPRTPEETTLLAKSDWSGDSIIVDSVFLRVPDSDFESIEEMVTQLDNHVVEIETRKRLDRNGFFVGLVRGNVPPLIQRWLDENDKNLEEDPLEKLGMRGDLTTTAARWHCRLGERKTIPLRAQQNESIVVLHSGASITGTTFELPQLDWAVVPSVVDGGQVVLEFTPEIKHGEMKKEIIGKDFGFRTEFRKQSHVFEDLRMRTRLDEGDILVICGTESEIGLGSHFCWTKMADQTTQRVIMLFRLTSAPSSHSFAKTTAAKSSR